MTYDVANLSSFYILYLVHCFRQKVETLPRFCMFFSQIR